MILKKILPALALLLILAAAAGAQTAAPVLTPIGAQTVDEGTPLSLHITATDADATIPVLSTSTTQPGMVFVDSLNGAGSLVWTPDFTQSGVYQLTFYAADAVTPDIDSEVVTITVNNVNQPPVLAAIGPQTVDENTLLTVSVSATDADGTTPTLTTSTPTDRRSFHRQW